MVSVANPPFVTADFVTKQMKRRTKRTDPRIWKCGLSDYEIAWRDAGRRNVGNKRENNGSNVRKRKSARSRNEKLKMRWRKGKWQWEFEWHIKEAGERKEGRERERKKERRPGNKTETQNVKCSRKKRSTSERQKISEWRRRNERKRTLHLTLHKMARDF